MKLTATEVRTMEDVAHAIRDEALAVREYLWKSGDVLIDDATRGLVLKSPNGHYWRATISDLGVVTWTDLGTTKP